MSSQSSQGSWVPSGRLWFMLPVVTLVVLGALGYVIIGQLQPVAADAMHIDVTARRWQWDISYPDQAVDLTNKLYVPEGVPVLVRLTSVDVVHSFWIPELNLQEDAIPHRVQTMTLVAGRQGEFQFVCAHYCGAGHTKMVGKVIVLPPEQFQAWLHSQHAAPNGDGNH